MPRTCTRRRTYARLVLAVALGATSLAVLATGASSAATAVEDSFAGAPSGYATGTTGGAGRPEIVVTSLGDSGPGTLRQAFRDGGGLITFAPGLSGSIEPTTAMRIPSNTTVDGRGADITMRGWGLEMRGVENVIVRNLKFRHIDQGGGDALGIRKSRRIWLDHLDFADEGHTAGMDGLIDATRDSTDITISWSRFTDHAKAMLLGWHEAEGLPELSRMTLHHNHIVDAHIRLPMVRHGHFEITNNVYDDWGVPIAGSTQPTKFAIGAFCGAHALVRGNVFSPEHSQYAVVVGSNEHGCDSTRSPASRLVDNVLNGATAMEVAPDQVADPPSETAVAVEPPDEALQAKVRQFAGFQPTGGLFPSPTTTEATTTTTETTTTTTETTTTTTETTTTTIPTAASSIEDAPAVTMQWVASTKLRIEWTPVAEARHYEWSVRTCAGVVVRSGLSSGDARRADGLSQSECYEGWVRVIRNDLTPGATGRAQITPGSTSSTPLAPLPAP